MGSGLDRTRRALARATLGGRASALDALSAEGTWNFPSRRRVGLVVVALALDGLDAALARCART